MERVIYTFSKIFLGLSMETGVANRPGLAAQLWAYIQIKVLFTSLCNSHAYTTVLSDSVSAGSTTAFQSISRQAWVNRFYELIYPIYKNPAGLLYQYNTTLIAGSIPIHSAFVEACVPSRKPNRLIPFCLSALMLMAGWVLPYRHNTGQKITYPI